MDESSHTALQVKRELKVTKKSIIVVHKKRHQATINPFVFIGNISGIITHRVQPIPSEHDAIYTNRTTRDSFHPSNCKEYHMEHPSN